MLLQVEITLEKAQQAHMTTAQSSTTGAWLFREYFDRPEGPNLVFANMGLHETGNKVFQSDLESFMGHVDWWLSGNRGRRFVAESARA